MVELYWHRAASSKLFSAVFGRMKTLNAKRGARRDPPRPTKLAAWMSLAVALAGVLVWRLREPVCQGKTVSAWIEELGDNSSAAAKALREIGPGTVAPLIQALERKPAGWLKAYAIVVIHSPRFLKPTLANRYSDIARRESRLPRVRAAAAQVLGDFGPEAGRATPALVKALGDTNATLRLHAAFALGKIGATPELAVPALAGLLGDRNEEVRMYAAIALKKFGTQAAAAVPALIATLKDRGWQVRDRSALALGAAGQHQTSVVSALEEALRDEHRFVRSSAATALAALAPRAKSARVALQNARYDPDAEVRYSAGLAVSQIDSEADARADLK